MNQFAIECISSMQQQLNHIVCVCVCVRECVCVCVCVCVCLCVCMCVCVCVCVFLSGGTTYAQTLAFDCYLSTSKLVRGSINLLHLYNTTVGPINEIIYLVNHDYGCLAAPPPY